MCTALQGGDKLRVGARKPVGVDVDVDVDVECKCKCVCARAIMIGALAPGRVAEDPKIMSQMLHDSPLARAPIRCTMRDHSGPLYDWRVDRTVRRRRSTIDVERARN